MTLFHTFSFALSNGVKAREMVYPLATHVVWGALLLRSLVEIVLSYSLSEVNPITINFCDCRPWAVSLLAASLPWECFEVSVLQDHFNADRQRTPWKPTRQLIVPLTPRRHHLLEIPCDPFSVACIVSREWTLPGAVRCGFHVLYGLGCQQQYIARLCIQLSQRKRSPPLSPKLWINMAVFLVAGLGFFFINIFKHSHIMLFFFCFLMIFRSLSCWRWAMNSTVTRHLGSCPGCFLSLFICCFTSPHIFFILPKPFLAQITVIDRVAWKMGKRKGCLAAYNLPAFLLDLHWSSGYARQFFSRYIANHVRWRQF